MRKFLTASAAALICAAMATVAATPASGGPHGGGFHGGGGAPRRRPRPAGSVAAACAAAAASMAAASPGASRCTAAASTAQVPRRWLLRGACEPPRLRRRRVPWRFPPQLRRRHGRAVGIAWALVPRRPRLRQRGRGRGLRSHGMTAGRGARRPGFAAIHPRLRVATRVSPARRFSASPAAFGGVAPRLERLALEAGAARAGAVAGIVGAGVGTPASAGLAVWPDASAHRSGSAAVRRLLARRRLLGARLLGPRLGSCLRVGARLRRLLGAGRHWLLGRALLRGLGARRLRLSTIPTAAASATTATRRSRSCQSEVAPRPAMTLAVAW